MPTGVGMFVGVHLDEILRGILSQRSPLNRIVALSASVYFYRRSLLRSSSVPGTVGTIKSMNFIGSPSPVMTA